MDLDSTLKLYDEKFEKLRNSTLISELTNNGWNLSYNFETGIQLENCKIPHEEAIDSYVLNLRFFIQWNEPISLIRLKSTYLEHCKNEQLKNEFLTIVEIFNSEIDKKWPIKVNDNELSYRNIFEGFIYSRIAHSSMKNHKLFYQISEEPLTYYLCLDSFFSSILIIHKALTVINELNHKAFN